ncbi:MAG: hypothetical protein HOO91_07455 [Bacteroidales bacterium]|nr:hypothetical protein [Bacteroidales bacterium]
MSIYEEVLLIGGHGGSPFSASGKQLSLVKTIRIWKGTFDKHRMIKSIEVVFTDETIQKFGVSEGNLDYEFTFEEKEFIKKLSLWGNGNGKRFGKIYFETTNGKKFDTGHCDGKDEFTINTGSGLWVGIEGTCGSDIDQCGFRFIKPISKMELINVIYPSLIFDTLGIAPVSLDKYELINDSEVPINWHFAKSVAKDIEHTWGTTVGVEVWGEYSVKGGIPEVVEIESKFGWKVSATQFYQRTTKSTKILSWDNSGVLNPKESISLTALTRQGELPSLEVKGDMVISTTDGQSMSFPIIGNYKGIDYSGVEIKTK